MWSLRGPSSVLGTPAVVVAAFSLSVGTAAATPPTAEGEGPPGVGSLEVSQEDEVVAETGGESESEKDVSEDLGSASGTESGGMESDTQSGGEQEAEELVTLALEEDDEPLCGIPDATYTGTPSGRLSGKNRYATAVEVAGAVKSSPVGEGRALFVASGQSFADGLALGALAAKHGWPLMLTSRHVVSAELRDHAAELQPTHIYIAGGPGAISTSVENQLKALGSEGVEVTRFAGVGRYETSAKIAECFPEGSPAVVTTGATFPDAVVSAAPAAKLGAPIVLTKPGKLGTPAAEALGKLEPSEVVVIGGTWSKAVLSSIGSLTATGGTPTVLAGKDRYLTAQAVAEHFYGATPATAVLASGSTFPDALAGVSVAASLDAPILLTKKACRPKGIETLMKGIKNPVFLGGTGALTAAGHSKTCVVAPKVTTQNKVVTFAKTHNGKGHRSGGTGPDSFDCSGFTQYVYGQAGVSIPRTTWEQWMQGKKVTSNPTPGDIAVMEGGGHVAIYLGGDLIIDAGNTRVGVSIRKMWQTPAAYVRFG